MGQQIKNFSDSFNMKISTYNLLPGFQRLFIKTGIIDIDLTKIELFRKSITGTEYNVFGFFVKDYMGNRKASITYSILISVCLLLAT